MKFGKYCESTMPIHHHDHFTFSELEQREVGNGELSRSQVDVTKVNIIVTQVRSHTHSNFAIRTNMTMIILKIMIAVIMMIIMCEKRSQ